MAVIITIYVIRFMRSFDTEIQKQITDLQEARIEEAKRREALRGELLKRVVAAQESERQRIARELHDETGQALTAIGLGLRGASSAIDKNITKAKQNLRQLEAMSASSLDELQRLIANLRPAHLDDLGLVAATRWHTNEVMSHTGLEIQFSVIGKERPLHDTVKIATYRIVQEAITNVIKHADASKVYVEMCFQPNELCLVVSDNGRGMEFKSESELMQRSWGLLGMRERTKLLDGEFHIESAPSKGVKIEVSIPYQLQLTDSLIITENGEEIEVTDDHPSAVSG
jgi:signal transduction histidine kinase